MTALLYAATVYAEPQHLTILHFNDLHGHVEQVAKLAYEINKIKAENEKKGWFTLVFFGGDLISGTPVSAKYKGEAEITFLNAIHNDASAIGNHDFDQGLDKLVTNMNNSKFPHIAANIYERKGGKLFVKPYIIFNPAHSLKIAVFGLSHPGTPSLTNPTNVATLKFDQPIPVAQKLMPKLEKETNVQIALTHEGVKKDIELAENVKGLDAVIGGHDHVKAENYCNEVKSIPVCQTPPNGEALGRVDLEIDGNKVKELGHELIVMNSAVENDPAVSAIMNPFISSVSKEMKEVVGFANEALPHERDARGTRLGELISRSMKEYTGADFGMMNSGGIRRGLKRGNITRGDIEEVLALPNIVVKVEVTGAEVENLRNHHSESSSYMEWSGLLADAVLDPHKRYTIATIDFLANASPELKKGHVVQDTKKYINDIFTEYIKREKKI